MNEKNFWNIKLIKYLTFAFAIGCTFILGSDVGIDIFDFGTASRGYGLNIDREFFFIACFYLPYIFIKIYERYRDG